MPEPIPPALDAGARSVDGPALRLVEAPGPRAVHLAPSLVRMGAAGRLAIAAVLAAAVWAATLAVIAR
jgi:hypothetical protein